MYRTVRKKDFVFHASVRFRSQYCPVFDCILYSCARKRLWLSLWLGLAVGIFQFRNVYRTVRKMDFVFLARVRVSSQYFLVLDCISHSCTRKKSWLSLWLGLAVDIFQLWNVYRTVRKKDFVFLARVRVSSPYFPGFGLYIIQLRKKEIVALAVVRVSSGYFWVMECTP